MHRIGFILYNTELHHTKSTVKLTVITKPCVRFLFQVTNLFSNYNYQLLLNYTINEKTKSFRDF